LEDICCVKSTFSQISSMKTCFCGEKHTQPSSYCLSCLKIHRQNQTKFCTVCRKLFAWEEFGKSKSGELFDIIGLCKSCTSIRCRESRARRSFKFCGFGECKYKTNSNADLEIHKRRHEGIKPFKCDFDGCEFVAVSKADIHGHKSRHSDVKDICCPYEKCDYMCNKGYHLTSHIENIHTCDLLYACDFDGCEYAFSKKGNLENHRLTHAGTRKFECDWPDCTYAAVRKATLLDHQAIHLEKRDFICTWTECTQAFKTSGSLWRHRQIHENKRAYACKQPNCTYTFNFHSYLVRHEIQMHSEEAMIDRKREETKIVEILDAAGIHYTREWRNII
jgi:hypothetical protein